jgi:hypothetical protein
MVNRGELCGETWCDCGGLCGCFWRRKTCHFFKLSFRIIPDLGQFDGAVERGLDGGQVWRNWACPGYSDTGEGFGDEEAVPGAKLPGTVGVGVADADGGVDELSELGDTRLGYHGRASGSIGGDRAIATGEVGALHVTQAGGSIAGARAAYGEEAHPLRSAGDQFAIEAAADKDRKPVVAEGPHAGEHTAVPEGIDCRRGDVEADSSAGFADVLVAEGGTDTQGDNAREAGNDG